MLQLSAMPRLPYICPWCLQWFFSDLGSHILSSNHKDHKKYKAYLTLKKTNPKVFKKTCSLMNLQGRVRNNIRALSKKDRDIVPVRRGKKHEGKDNSDHVWCTLCHTVVTMKGLKDSHLKTCAQSKNMTISPDVLRQLTKSAVAVLEPEAVTIKNLLKGKPLVYQEVLLDLRSNRLALTLFVLNDPVAQALISRMASVGRGKNSWIPNIRLRMRILFAAFTYFKQLYGDKCKSLMDMMKYDLWHAPVTIGTETFPALVAACYVAAGREPEKNKFKSCNDVMLFSSVFQQVPDIVLYQIHHSREMLLVWKFEGKQIKNYMVSDAWKSFTVRPAARQKALDNNFKSVIVPPEDFQQYLSHVEDKARSSIAALMAAWEKKDRIACLQALITVVQALPLAIGAFSYRRASEPFTMRTANVKERPQLQKLLKEHSHVVTPGADTEINKFIVVESRGKGDNAVYTVIKNEFVAPLDLLCDHLFRAFIGVPEENDYVFPNMRSRNSLGHAHPTRCQAKYAKQCEGLVKNHLELRSRYFRTTFATNLCGMNLTYNTKKLMCALMGHSMVVHENYYNIPQPLQMAAYMGYACQASAENKIRDMSATTIEEHVDKLIPTDTGAPVGIPDM